MTLIRFGTNVVLLHGCLQSCIPNPVEGLLVAQKVAVHYSRRIHSVRILAHPKFRNDMSTWKRTKIMSGKKNHLQQ